VRGTRSLDTDEIKPDISDILPQSRHNDKGIKIKIIAMEPGNLWAARPNVLKRNAILY
jgi:hypothetical protein